MVMDMTAHAVSQTSGAVPLLARDTAPSESRQPYMPAPTAPVFRRQDGPAIEDALTPPREARSTDLTKASVPLPFMLTIIGLVVSIAIGVLSIKSDVRLIDERITHEKELRMETERRRDEQFKTLEAKIESAGLRNFNAAIAQELAKQKERQ